MFIAALVFGLLPTLVQAQIPSHTEIAKWLVVSMGDDSDVGRAFQMSDTEIGADKNVLSNSESTTPAGSSSFPNLLGVFGTRWDTSTDPDQLDDHHPVFQGIDWSGNAALTSNNGAFDASNSLVYADFGIGSACTGSNCQLGGSVSNSVYFPDGSLSHSSLTSAGTSNNNNFSQLLTDLGAWKTFINGLSAETTITSLGSYQNNEASGGSGGLRQTYGDVLDTNGDGIILVDVNLGGSDFDLTNLDWVIDGTGNKLIIFRINNGSNMLLSNVSITMGTGGIDALGTGFIFYQASDGSSSGDAVFNGDNVVLDGGAFWDLNDIGEGGGDIKTNIVINNGQGCWQFVSQKVDFQNNRWNRCSFAGLSTATLDLGDLPDPSFETLTASNGASHEVVSDLYLGSCVDTETDGAPDAYAGLDGSGGDDTTAGSSTRGTCTVTGDDEDGVTLLTPLVAGSEACIAVSSTAPTTANLNAWIDFNGDGDFTGDANEQIVFTKINGASVSTTNGTISSGTNANIEYCFNVPAGATHDGGEVHARYRLSTAGGLSYTGQAVDGEVEDYHYPLACVGNYVWDDFDNQGDQDEVGVGIPNVGVMLTWFGPDNTLGGGDDETYTDVTDASGQYGFCGLRGQDGSSNGGTYQVTIPNPIRPLTSPVDAVADDQDNDGTQPGGIGTVVITPAFTIQAPNYGTAPNFFNLPTSESGTTDSSPPPGNYPDTSVDQTIDVGFDPADYGDLPDSDGGTGSFPTNNVDGSEGIAAVHGIIPGMHLGSCVDAEVDGQPDSFAGLGASGGDDPTSGFLTEGTCSGSDDEDGISLITPLIAGQEACVAVSASTGSASILNAWIDFNGDGDFAGDADEQVVFTKINGVTLGAPTAQGGVPSGTTANVEYCFNVPAGATFDGGETHARYRFSTAGGLNYHGPAANGEVEDYYHPLACVGNFVWLDIDEGGNQNGEPGLNSITVQLRAAGADNVLDTSDDHIYSVVTAQHGGVDGKYHFCGLSQGNYRIEIPTPPGAFPDATIPNNTGDEDTDSDGLQPGGYGNPVFGPDFSIPAPEYDGTPYALPTGENSDGDGTPPAGNYPDASTNLQFDFGFFDSGNLPVELSTFDAIVKGMTIQLTWQTLSEENNAGFAVEYAYDEGDFLEAAFVEGAGTTEDEQQYRYTLSDMNPGSYQVRLRQVDYDGGFEYSPVLNVEVELPGTYHLDAYPNPFNPSTMVRFTVKRQQPVRLALYDLTGRLMRVLYDGSVPANEVQAVRIDATGLASGIYVVRLQGENFVGIEKITLVK